MLTLLLSISTATVADFIAVAYGAVDDVCVLHQSSPAPTKHLLSRLLLLQPVLLILAISCFISKFAVHTWSVESVGWGYRKQTAAGKRYYTFLDSDWNLLSTAEDDNMWVYLQSLSYYLLCRNIRKIENIDNSWRQISLESGFKLCLPTLLTN